MKKHMNTQSLILLSILTLITAVPRSTAQTGWGSALQFDGVDDYVEVPSGVVLANTSFTVEAWASNGGDSGWILGQGTGSDHQGLHIGFNPGGTFKFGFSGDPLYTTTPYPDSDWHHWAATYDAVSREQRIFRNGQLVASRTANSSYVGTGPMRIGNLTWTGPVSFAFEGAIDEVRIWDVARTEAEIQADMYHLPTGTEPGLIAYYRFDEGTGTNTYDATTNHFDGTLNNPGWTNSTIPPPPPFSYINAGLPAVLASSVAWGDYDNDGDLDILLTGIHEENDISQVWQNNGNGSFTNINAALPGVRYSSVAWGDYDNDGDLDILLTGDGDNISQVWRNNGDGSFSENINAALPGVRYSSAAWGDYDNDGRPDILLTGEDDNQDPISQVWRNNGDGTFSDIEAGLPGVYKSSVAWGDYDNDGDLDILLTGDPDDSDPISQVWRNNGDGTFSENIAAELPGVYEGSAAWGDYDNDGDLDILLTGSVNYLDGAISQVWRNNGDGTFSDIEAGLTRVYDSSVAWGDYDNDGDLDILLTGAAGVAVFISQVWRNNGDGTFSDINAGLTGVYQGSVAWGDYDNDGRLDILLTGYLYQDWISQLWRNNGPVSNAPPSAPTNLSAVVAVHSVALSWNPASDGQTPADGLTYNLRMGTFPGGSDVVSPQASTNGFRRLPAAGNVQLGTHAFIKDLPDGVYYWSVQAVDSAYSGSSFAGEQIFVTLPETLPATNVGLTSATLNGLVNPLGKSTAVWFEWGATTNYAHSTSVIFEDNGTNALPVSGVVTGWVQHVYHYRVVATNEWGWHYGNDIEVAMQLEPPQVSTQSALVQDSESALLRVSVNPRERDTLAWFEYGFDQKYGGITAQTNIGHGTDFVAIGISATDLVPWMTYHYRAAASNSVGLTTGSDMTFTLPGPVSDPPELLSALGDIEILQGGSTQITFMVSPADLDVYVHCNNPVLLPESGLELDGSGTWRDLDIEPDPIHSGSAQITVTAGNGSLAVSDTFTLTVTPSVAEPMLSMDVESSPGGNLHLQVFDEGMSSTGYVVEYRADLTDTNDWVPATNIVELVNGDFEIDLGPSPGDAGFYRIIGLGASGNDAGLLEAGFYSPETGVAEGAGFGGAVVVFSEVFVGSLNYAWTDETGTTWSNTLAVAGTTAVIPLPAVFLEDDSGIGQLQHLTLHLEEGSGYVPAGTTENRVTIEENDANWQGVIETDGALLGFTLSMFLTNGTVMGWIQSDGFGFFPTNALVQLTFAEDTFTAVATDIALPVFAGDSELVFTNYLDLRLDAANSAGETNISPAQIEGEATLIGKVPYQPHLDAAVSGPFILLKSPTASSTNEVPLYPVSEGE